MSQGTDFEELDLRRLLLDFPTAEVPWTRGLIQFDPAAFLPTFWEHWGAFFHACGVELSAIKTSVSMEPLSADAKIYPFQLEGETAVIACDEPTQLALADALLGRDAPAAARECAIEYLARRLVASVSLSNSGGFNSYFIGRTVPDEIEVAAVMHVSFSVGSKKCALQIGLGPQTCARLDELWKARLKTSVNAGKPSVMRVQLAALAVPPSDLIDYLREDSVIDLALPFSNRVTLLLDDKVWATAEIFCDSEGLPIEQGGGLLLRYEGPEAEPELEPGLSLLSLELCAFEIEQPLLAEFTQESAMLQTGCALSSEVALLAGSEYVARAALGMLGSQLAIRVLPA